MKIALKICFGVICFFLSANSFCQSSSSHIAHIKKYKASIDSLRAIYLVMIRSLDEDSMRQAWAMGLGEGVGDGEYTWTNKDGSEGYGGSESYTFAKNQGEIYRIYWGGNKKGVRVSKTFYYENGKLVYGEMTVQREGPHPSAIYNVKEFYWNNKRIEKITKNKFPVIENRELIPGSLLKDGKKFYDLYKDDN